MKQKLFLLFSFLFIGITACEDMHDGDDRPSAEKNHLKTVEVKLKLDGDISLNITKNPLGGRALMDADDTTYYLVGISVFDSDIIVDDGIVPFVPYAAGAFDHIPDDLTLNLTEGEMYEVSVQAVRPGASAGIITNLEGDSIYRFAPPPEDPIAITNELIYDSDEPGSLIGQLNDFEWQYTTQSGTLVDPSNTAPTLVEVFFGQSTITANNELAEDGITVSLFRQVFGVGVQVSGLELMSPSVAVDFELSGGILQQRFEADGPTDFSAVLSFDDLWWSAEPENNVSDYDVSVLLRDTIPGTPPSPVETVLFSGEVDFTRLEQTNFQITVSPSEASAGFEVTFDDAPLTDGDTVNISN